MYLIQEKLQKYFNLKLHETKISGWLEPLIHTIKVNDQFSEGCFVDFLRFDTAKLPSIADVIRTLVSR